jgi:hypothetical protein
MKEKKQAPPPDITEAGNPYELKTEAVRRLAEADNISVPTKGKLIDPGKKYRSGFLDKIPGWIKALFIKFWFNGAVCFFIYWGLGLMIPSMENMIIILSIVLGMVTDLLVNNTFRFIATVPGENDKWIMFPKKRYISIVLNILYAFAVLLVVIGVYNAINVLINMILGTSGTVYLGVEPILFGLFYMGVDMLLIAWKNLFVRIVNDAKKSTDR